MTIPMAARLVHVNTGAMRTYIHSHRCTLEEAYDHYADSEERRINQAVVRLLDIINPNGGTAHEDCA